MRSPSLFDLLDDARPRSISLDPPLKWAGGKRWLVPALRSYWLPHHHRRLVEPFLGGAVVVLGLQPARALLNDANPHLMNFYRHVQRGLAIDLPMAYEKSLFYQHRARFNVLATNGGRDNAEAASIFYFLNRTGFNGLCRFNQRGQFNVPFGQYKTVTYTRTFPAHQAAFTNWAFTSTDFADVPVTPDDLLYVDPPYDVEFTQYEPSWRGWPDQVRLAEWLAQHPGPVVASNQATDRVVALYRRLGFDLQLVDAPRRINCTGDRTPARELLASRNMEAR